MAKTAIKLAALGGGGSCEYEYVSNISFGTGNITVTIPTTKRAKRIIFGGGYNTTNPHIMMAEDGDTKLYQNDSPLASMTVTWNDNSIVLTGTFSSGTSYKYNAYIVY